MEAIAVIDFETTGEPSERGGRATEIAVAILSGGKIVDRHQSLMRTGAWISPFIEELTGISNEMVARAPPAHKVMAEAARFVGKLPMAAHNAAFDAKVWRDELRLIGEDGSSPFACTMLLARRVFPMSPNHKLTTLARHLRIPQSGRAHRAMVDAESAALLLARIQESLAGRHGLSHAPFELLSQIQRVPKAKLAEAVARLAADGGCLRAPLAPRS